MARSRTVLLYGSTGYTASLLLPRLVASGMEVIAAGRDRRRVSEVAERLGVPARVFDLETPEQVDEGIRGVGIVLNAAGPFGRTAAPLIDGCLRQRIDYLDLAGELGPIAYAASCGEWARALGVMVLPAVGFDVVPTDCLAVHLLERLPTANRLTLTIGASNWMSRGSAKTLSELAGNWMQVRRDGMLESIRLRMPMRWACFGANYRPTVAVTWGDLVTAHHSTGIPNIEVYFEATAFRWAAVVANQFFRPLIASPAMKRVYFAASDTIPGGPNAVQRAAAGSVVVAEMTAPDGAHAGARLVLPEAYAFTAEVATRIVAEVIAGARRPGFQTPGRLFGADFVLRSPSVAREVFA